jgi:transposase
MNEGREQRIVALHEVAQGQLTAAAAAALLGLSVRQVRRLVKQYRRVGAQAVEHGNRGRQPMHAVPPELRQRIAALAQTTYQGCNHQHLSELLAEREGIAVSRATVRRILLAAGLHRAQSAGQRPPRQRRPRYPQAGMLVQLDGSAHAWLEGRGPRFTLLACIDDATGAVPAALFHPVEDAHGYFLLMQRLVAGAGRPLALYHDRHGIFQVNPKRAWSGQAQLAGHPEPTQFGRLLGELGITSIAAQSPQAKGRIERLFQTLQDRLVVELRLAGAATLADANACLARYLPLFNARFAVPASEVGSAYRPLDPAQPPATLFCFKYRRTVAADNTVQFAEQTFQLVPSVQRLSWAKAAVEVHERLDGSIAIYHQGAHLTSTPAPPTAPTLRARGGPRGGVAAQPPATAAAWPADDSRETPPPPAPATPAPPAKPAPDHPWRRGTRARR